ncbi:hypothetical protein [Allokutzneria oryzae]|uniref:DUF3558 domain-containing protein n=1 Tax=Allokutzneria oryzae TaxID=1378989 RepID=A0ABV6A3I4_9PSEU
MVLGIAVAVVLLVVAGIFGKLYLDYIEQPGKGPGEQPVAQCNLSSGLRQLARVSSFRLAIPPATARTMKHSSCVWEQTAGKDGKDTRGLRIHVYDYRDANRTRVRNLEQAKGTYTSYAKSPVISDRGRPLEGTAEEATFVLPSGGKADLTEVDLVARKGEVVHLIAYFGHDKGLFSNSEFPTADAEDVVRKVAEELVAEQPARNSPTQN